MKKLIAWAGYEQEGELTGAPSLFIRGGYENYLALALARLEEMHLGVRLGQIYFGAGSSVPDMASVDSNIGWLNLMGAYSSINVTVEIEVGKCEIIVPKNRRVRLVLTCVVPELPSNVEAIKFRTDKELLINMVVPRRVSIGDATGKFPEDIPVIEIEE